MTIDELKDKLSADKDYEVVEDADGLVVKSKRYKTVVKISPDGAKHDWQTIKSQLAGGRDVKHITRVTGYFTIVEGWNKGKLGELKDRARSVV